MAWRIAVFVVLALALAGGGWAAVCGWRWRRGTEVLRRRLESGRIGGVPPAFDARELAALPAPVRRYLLAVLRPGQAIPAAASVTHRGTFSLGEERPKWMPFTSTQRVVADRPGFDWDARIAMGFGLAARVHDGYVLGEGVLHAELLGWTLADQRATSELAIGELQRFLAEAPWMPTLLLPGQSVGWESIDDTSARATLADGSTIAMLDFHFGDDGLVDRVSTPGRYRLIDGKPVATPWEGRFWNYAERGGMRVPLDGEVAWLLPAGPLPYWRGHLESIVYDVEPSR
jgi:hypothetical protein